MALNLTDLTLFTNQTIVIGLKIPPSDASVALDLHEDRLDVKVSTRADQATANAIKTKVDGLSTANLDATISSRADQATAAATDTHLDTALSSRAEQGTVQQRYVDAFDAFRDAYQILTK